MTDNQWQQLAAALRELHRALMLRAQRDYEHDHLVFLNPPRLLQLLTTDPYFEWLRGLSELMVDIDLAREEELPLRDDLAAAVRASVEYFISVPKAGDAGSAFAAHYWPYIQDDPHVAMAHAAVKQAVAQWPQPTSGDAASLLHERHVLAEKARHRTRKS